MAIRRLLDDDMELRALTGLLVAGSQNFGGIVREAYALGQKSRVFTKVDVERAVVGLLRGHDAQGYWTHAIARADVGHVLRAIGTVEEE